MREVRKRVVLQRCRGLALYMVRSSATVLFLRETHTHTWCQLIYTERSESAGMCVIAWLVATGVEGVKSFRDSLDGAAGLAG